MKKILELLVCVSSLIGAFFFTGCGELTLQKEELKQEKTQFEVVSTNPGASERDVPLNTSILINLSNEINPSASGSEFLKIKAKGEYIQGIYEIKGDSKSIVFYPSKNLIPSTDYSVSLSGIMDKGGNRLTSDSYTFGFTTATITTYEDPSLSALCEDRDKSKTGAGFHLVNNYSQRVYIFQDSVDWTNILACVGGNKLDFGIDLPGDEEVVTLLAINELNIYKLEDSPVFDQIRALTKDDGSWAPILNGDVNSTKKGRVKIDNRLDNIIAVKKDSYKTGERIGYINRSSSSIVYTNIGLQTLIAEIIPDTGMLSEGPNKRVQLEEDSLITWIVSDGSPEPSVDSARIKVVNYTDQIQILLEGDEELYSKSGGGVGPQKEKLFPLSAGFKTITVVNDTTGNANTISFEIKDSETLKVIIEDTGITVLTPPRHTAGAVEFTDTDNDKGEIGGEVKITKAEDETDVVYYKMFWAGDSKTIIGNKPITSLKANGGDLIHTIPEDTIIPANATRILVLTSNDSSEMTTGVSIPIEDNTNSDGDNAVVQPQQQIETKGFLYEILGCKRDGIGDITCELQITSKEADKTIRVTNKYYSGDPSTRIFDDLGYEYSVKSIQLGNKDGTSMVESDLILDTPTKAIISFEGVSKKANKITLFDIGCVAGKDNFTVQFKDVDIEEINYGGSGLVAKGFAFELQACKGDNTGGIECELEITSKETDKTIRVTNKYYSGDPSTRIFDDLGYEYSVKSIQLGNKDGTSTVENLLVTDIPTKAILYFEGVAKDAVKIALLDIGCNANKRNFQVQFRNITIE